MLLSLKSFEILKHKVYIFISESFTLRWYFFVALTNKKPLLSLLWRLKQSFFCSLEKLIEYYAPAVNIVSSNVCVGALPRIKILL